MTATRFSAFGALLQSFSDGIRSGMDAMWDANFITQTPPALTYQNDDIRGLYGAMRSAANAALVAIATLGALNGVLRPHLGLKYHSLVNTAVWWVQFAIDVNNALAASIGNATPRNWNTMKGAHQALTDIHPVLRRLSSYPGGRGGKECVANLLAEQRLAPGGGAP